MAGRPQGCTPVPEQRGKPGDPEAGCRWVLPSAAAPQAEPLPASGRDAEPRARSPSSSHLLPELDLVLCSVPPAPHRHRGQPPRRHHGAGRGRSHPGAPRQLREGAGWVLAWARRLRAPLLSPAANAKSIRHVSAPQGNRLRPAEGSSQGRRRRLGGSAQGGRPGMCRAKAPLAADALHPPTAAGSLLPSAGPTPRGLRGPGGSGREETDRPAPRTGSPQPPGSGSSSLGSRALETRIPANGASTEEAEPWPSSSAAAVPGEQSGTEPDHSPGPRRDAAPGAGDMKQSERGRGRCRGDGDREVAWR